LARAEIRQLATRLAHRVAKRPRIARQRFPEETPVDDWQEALVSLSAPAARGFWTNEGRLLYDLQKVCMERERGVFRVDLIEWRGPWGLDRSAGLCRCSATRLS
jgi:hypothetical protein